MIKISNISKSFGDIKALDNLSLDIQDAKVFGLLGVNGAGKTTLLSILNGLIEVDSGEVEIFGLDMKKDKKEILNLSSIVPQHLAFYEKLSVKENLDFFGKIQKSTKDALDKAIFINSLQDLLNQKASTLSGGQKRRLNIAIGLLNDPKILYFDEPTVGIDPKSRNEILDSIKNHADLGITVVYTSHYMNEIERICSDVAIIEKGKIIKTDELKNLLSSRVSNKVFIETIYDENLKTLNLAVSENNTIQTDTKNLSHVLEVLSKNTIHIKNIRYGSTNLEKYFLEVTA